MILAAAPHMCAARLYNYRVKDFFLFAIFLFLPQIALAGSQTFTTSGTFTVPAYGTLTVEVWGGGGGGGVVVTGIASTQSTPGEKSVFSTVEAGGGRGGISEHLTGQLPGAVAAQGGMASGGGVNLTGGISPSSPSYPGHYSSTAGSAPFGGAGGVGGDPDYWCPAHIPGILDVDGRPGAFPGGGGGGAESTFGGIGGGGGAGAYAKKTYAQNEVAAGTTVPVTVGAGGTGAYFGVVGWCIGNANYQYYWNGGTGAPGQVIITWTDPVNSPPTTPVITGPTSGFTKTNYTYTFRSTDPDSDTIRYGIDWDDNGTVDEYVPALGYVSSGTTGSATHSWNSSNTQTFKALAQDSLGNTSGWASYSVNMSPNAPTVLLTALPPAITTGQSSVLTWSSSNAASCTGTNFSTGAGSPTSGTQSVSPTVTTVYTVTCTGAGGTASDSKTVTYTCTAQNYCGTGANANRRYNGCTGAEITPACSYQCGGAGLCIAPPPPAVIPGLNGLTGALQVVPSLVRSGDPTNLYWNINYVSACTVTGGGVSWSGTTAGCDGTICTSGSTGKVTSAITQRTTFSLSCTGLDSSATSSSATVNILPVFQEL